MLLSHFSFQNNHCYDYDIIIYYVLCNAIEPYSVWLKITVDKPHSVHKQNQSRAH